MRDPLESPVFDRSMPQPAAIARAILEGFDRHYRLFRYVAQQAKGRFENGDWFAMREAAKQRIDFYDQRVLEAATRIERDFDLESLTDEEHDAVWQAVKQRYVTLLAEHRQPELAETFFNSVCTKLLRHLTHQDHLGMGGAVALGVLPVGCGVQDLAFGRHQRGTKRRITCSACLACGVDGQLHGLHFCHGV